MSEEGKRNPFTKSLIKDSLKENLSNRGITRISQAKCREDIPNGKES